MRHARQNGLRRTCARATLFTLIGLSAAALVPAVAHEQDAKPAPPAAPPSTTPTAPGASSPAASRPGAFSDACFAPTRLETQREFERALSGAPTTDSLRASHDLLASRPHIAGTPGGLAGAERLAARLREFPGLDVATAEYSVWLPRAASAELEIVGPTRRPLPVRERRIPEADPFTAHVDPDAPDLDLGWNGYSGSGEATGPVVYANYGTKDDFAKLKEQGVSCEGAIVLARYGGNFRGYKAKFAQEAGAAGLLIYTDPGDSGYAQGPVYPEGPWANETYIQRGSIDTLPYDGDPLTPGVASIAGAARLDPASVALPRIPVQPIGYGAALEIMREMTGPPVHSGAGAVAPPGKAWQGGLPLTYRLTGGDALRVRLKVDQPRAQRPIRNVIASLRGARFPEQTVIVGAHHDAWGYGADDPLSGTIVVVELAKAFADAAAKGFRPARTILFCGWDAEEFGIIGSSEWVEENARSLTDSCVAYINLDAAVSGWDFSASASPSLQRLIWDAASQVAQPADPRPGASNPTGPRSILEAWKSRQANRAPAAGAPQRRADQPTEPRPDTMPTIGAMGGGSDHTGFLTHLSIPCASMGFGGAGGTAYHSMYDTLAWYRLMMRNDYSSHAALTRVVALVLARLANADVIPYDHAAPSVETRRHLQSLTERAAKTPIKFDTASLTAALDRADASAKAAGEAIPLFVQRGVADASLAPVHAVQLATERAWFDARGLPERPWRRNLFMAPDETSGYASWPLPALRRAIERTDQAALEGASTDLTAAIDRLDAALKALASLVAASTGSAAHPSAASPTPAAPGAPAKP